MHEPRPAGACRSARVGPAAARPLGACRSARVGPAAARPLGACRSARVGPAAARPLGGRQHLGPDQAPGQPRGGGHPHARDRRRVPQFAAVPQHGQRLRQAKRARTQARYPGDHPPRDSLQPSSQQLSRLQRGHRPAAELGRPQQLGQVQRVTAAGRVHRRAQLIGGLAAGRRADHGTDRWPAQQRRPQHGCLRAHRRKRGTHRRRVALAQRHQHSRREPLQPRR